MFIPNTHHIELAGELRDTEMYFEKMTDYRLKMVEKAGTKVCEMLTDSDPWSGQDCAREKCWLWETKMLTGKNKRQECTKRNLVYETYCMSCEQKDMEERDKETEEGETIE